jgi:polyisoprenyl-teichoic acid--peptidoglycan teichoic acid transferase
VRDLLVTTLLRRVLSPSSAFTFLRRFAIALLAVVALTAVVLVSANAYGKKQFAKSRVVHIDDKVLIPVKPGQPANYLLLGSDVRPANETPQESQAYGTAAETGGQRSDVMMVLHVDPNGHSMLVSFPRDMVVDIPGHGRNLLNAAYSLGGPSLVILTLESYFKPLQINHYLEVDFRSFKSIVNAIGHIKLWLPTPVHDPYTGLNVDKAGCVSLDGDQALAYARSREYFIPDNLKDPAPWQWNYDPKLPVNAYRGGAGWHNDPLQDLDRIPRQQYFLRTLSADAIHKTGGNPITINDLLQQTFKYLAHDQNLTYGELKSLAYTFRDLDPRKVNMLTMPYEQDPADHNRVVAKYPDSVYVSNQLQDFTPPPKAIVKALSASRVSLLVVNGSGAKGAATTVATAFTAAGFRSAGPPADADRSDYKTTVRYSPGKFAEGYTVAVAVGTLNLVPAASSKDTLGSDVLLVVGTDYDSLKHRFDLVPRPGNAPPTTATTSPVTIAPTSSTTSTTISTTVNTYYVPVDPKTGGPLVGCPSK